MTIATASRPTATAAPARRKRVRRSGADELNTHLLAAADLKRQIDALELELQQHRSWLLAHLQTSGDTSVALGGFTAALRTRANWDYSPALAREMLRIKNEQKLEQMSGAATNKPTPYLALTFKAER
jgi:hypothetical protein